jgi:hypothetical protein
MYSLCVAHTNDFVEREDFVEASSGLLLTWAVGATLGPIAAGPMMEWVGLGGLFFYAAVVHLLFIAFIWHRTRRRASLPPAARPDFVQAGHTRTSHVLATMDPRAPEPLEAQATSDASRAPREAMK